MLTEKQQKEFVKWYKDQYYFGGKKKLPVIYSRRELYEINLWKEKLRGLLGKKADKVYKKRGRGDETVLDKVFNSLWLQYGPKTVEGGWSFTEYGINHLHFRGRNKLIIECFDKIQEHIDKGDYPYDLNIYYLKEKYGGLRVDSYGNDDYVLNLISELEYKSEEVCFECGKKGKTRYDLGRFQTLCLRHYLPLKIRQLWRKLKRKLGISERF